MRLINGLTPEEVFINLLDHDKQMSILCWAKRNDPLYCSLLRASNKEYGPRQLTTIIVGLLAGKIQAENELEKVLRNLQPPPICFPQSEKATEDIEKEKFEKWAEWRWFPTRIDKDHFWQGWKAARGL